MNLIEAKKILEALLFVSNGPLKVEKIKQLLEVDLKTVRYLADELRKDYDSTERSFTIREVANGYQISTRAEFNEWIRKLLVNVQENALSRAAIETLAIIAYKQPLTRVEIEDIRGVSISHVLKKLLEKKLIVMGGRKKVPGRPILYRTSPFFLAYFGLRDLSEMPQPGEFKDLLTTENEEGENE